MGSIQVEVADIIPDDPPISGDLMVENDLNSTSSQDGENELDELHVETPLLQPVASRFISCLRAPCLKTRSTNASSPFNPSTPSSGTLSPAFGTSPQSTATNPSLTSLSSSFMAIKEVSASRPKRQVHFDASPPESGITHSRENYDRRPIECTRGGSSFDLSLPPRGKCPSYSGEADDEGCTEEDNDSEDNDGTKIDNKERMRGFARWAKLKNGGTIFGGATLKYTAQSSATSKSATEKEEDDSNTCRLPTHGMIRSVGGLASSIGLANGENSIEELKSPSATVRTLRSQNTLSSSDDQDESDVEHAAFRQAVYAALSMSPNATPMPSPSVRTRWECVSSYFDQKLERAEAASNAALDDSSNSNNELKDSQDLPDLAETPAFVSEDVDKTPRAHPNVPDEMQTSFPITLTMPRAKLCLSSPTTDLSTNSFSSPISSRCSSTDTWSSNGLGTGDQELETDAFETEFAKSMASLGTTSMMEKFEESDRKFRQNEHTQIDVVSPCETSDSLETDQGVLSSTSMGGISSQGWMSSGATSPEIGPTDELTQNLKETMLDGVPTVEISTSDAALTAEDQNDSNTGVKPCSLTSFAKFPSFLSVHQRKAFSHSAPVSAANSPCILSGDEGDESDQLTKSHSSPLARTSSSSPRQRSTSGGSRKCRKTKRISSQDGSPVDSGDDAVSNGINSSPISSSRIRRGATQRSKSMSATQCSTIRKSSFSTCSFRSEIDDEGALGGF